MKVLLKKLVLVNNTVRLISEWQKSCITVMCVITNGTINGRLVYVFAQDFTVLVGHSLKHMLKKSVK
jgi:acetyl-CoA carboxylase carboxyltransferase component